MKKKTAFHVRIIAGMMTLITVMVAIIAAFTYFMSRATIDARINKEITATLTSKSLEFDTWVSEQQQSLSYYGDFIQYTDYISNNSDAEIEKFLTQKLTDYVLDYYVVIPDRATLFASATKLPDDFDVTQRGWYINSVNSNGEFCASSPYVDFNTGKLVMTISRAYYKADGTLDFVLGADVYADYLAEITSSVDIFDNAYPILADNEFNIIVHSNEGYKPSVSDDGTAVTKSMKDVAAYSEIVANIENNDFSVVKTDDFDGTLTYFVPIKIASTGWYYFYATRSIEYHNQMSALVTSMVLVFIIAIVTSCAVITLLVKAVVKPLDELKTAAVNMKQGKLGYTPTYYANDSISQLCTGISDTNRVWQGYIFDINRNLNKLSCGDFNLEFNGEYVGDFAAIKDSINDISDKLKTIIDGIDAAAAQVSVNSANVAESSNSLAQNVSNQSRTIDELTDLINQLVARIDENAASAEAAQKQADSTSENVVECNRRMTELMDSMDDINRKAEEIVKIVQAIDDIAFQTNILALNAAIEADRAGAAGKGFAVVADEVRNLASKSAEAVQSTQRLISGTGEAVQRGTALATETENALQTVSEGVESVNGLIMKISEASDVQANDVKNVSGKINAIEAAVHRTAETAQESANSSTELSTQSQALQDIVLEYRQIYR